MEKETKTKQKREPVFSPTNSPKEFPDLETSSTYKKKKEGGEKEEKEKKRKINPLETRNPTD